MIGWLEKDLNIVYSLDIGGMFLDNLYGILYWIISTIRDEENLYGLMLLYDDVANIIVDIVDEKFYFLKITRYMIWQIQDIIKSVEFIYWDDRPAMKEEYRNKLQEYTNKNNKTNLLASAIEISKDKEAKEQIVWIASAI